MGNNIVYAEIKFKDGSICIMELIYNWNGCHIYRTPDSYLIVPYKDVVIGRVTSQEYQKCQQEVKKAEPVKKEIVWSEVKTE